MPAKNARAMRNPALRDWLSEEVTTPAIPSPIGSVQGQTALARMPATSVTPRAKAEPWGRLWPELRR